MFFLFNIYFVWQFPLNPQVKLSGHLRTAQFCLFFVFKSLWGTVEGSFWPNPETANSWDWWHIPGTWGVMLLGSFLNNRVSGLKSQLF